MTLQFEEGMKRKASHGSNKHALMNQEEVAIIDGALKFREMIVSQVMTPESQVFMVHSTEKLSYRVILLIYFHYSSW
jgi:CBS domain containing-hemolysin-like protein